MKDLLLIIIVIIIILTFLNFRNEKFIDTDKKSESDVEDESEKKIYYYPYYLGWYWGGNSSWGPEYQYRNRGRYVKNAQRGRSNSNSRKASHIRSSSNSRSSSHAGNQNVRGKR